MSKRKGKLETYWKNANHNKFNIELKKFSGYITRKYFPGFRQNSELYEELFDIIKNVVYEKLLEGLYDSEKGNFESYLFTTIRGELTKFFNKFNRERKFLNTEDCYKESYDYELDDNYNSVVDSIEIIIKEYELDISLEDAIELLLHDISKKDCKTNVNNLYIKENLYYYEIKLISWVFIKRYGFNFK